MASLSHEEAQALIQRQLDTSLMPQEHEALDCHLQECADCCQYARRAIRFDAELAQSLPALWPARRTSPARLAEAVNRIERTGRSRGVKRTVVRSAQGVLALAALVVIVSVAMWQLQPKVRELEEAAFSDLVFRSDELATQYLSVHFDLDYGALPGDGIDLYYPLCDGVEYFPPAGSLARKLALGEPLPECEMRPSETILLAPGESRDVLLVYHNPRPEPVTFRFVPTTRTDLNRPFAAALCGARGQGNRVTGDCAPHTAPAHGLWAEFITFSAPPTAAPGSHVTVNGRIELVGDGE